MDISDRSDKLILQNLLRYFFGHCFRKEVAEEEMIFTKIQYRYQVTRFHNTDAQAPTLNDYLFEAERSIIVYSFICPDGRRYIGSVIEGRGRGKKLARMNPRIREALEKYPEDSWFYEVLARMPKEACMYQYAVEQMYIDMYHTMDPRYGFNMHKAYPSRIAEEFVDDDLPVNEDLKGYRAFAA